MEGGGDVAFVKHTTVQENCDGKRKEFWARNQLTADYQLLCRDGTPPGSVLQAPYRPRTCRTCSAHCPRGRCWLSRPRLQKAELILFHARLFQAMIERKVEEGVGMVSLFHGVGVVIG